MHAEFRTICFNYELCLVIIATCQTLLPKTGFPLQRAESFLPFQEATTSSHRGIILQAWKRGFSQSLGGIIFSFTKYILIISIELGSKIYPAASKPPCGSNAALGFYGGEGGGQNFIGNASTIIKYISSRQSKSGRNFRRADVGFRGMGPVKKFSPRANLCCPQDGSYRCLSVHLSI